MISRTPVPESPQSMTSLRLLEAADPDAGAPSTSPGASRSPWRRRPASPGRVRTSWPSSSPVDPASRPPPAPRGSAPGARSTCRSERPRRRRAAPPPARDQVGAPPARVPFHRQRSRLCFRWQCGPPPGTSLVRDPSCIATAVGQLGGKHLTRLKPYGYLSVTTEPAGYSRRSGSAAAGRPRAPSPRSGCPASRARRARAPRRRRNRRPPHRRQRVIDIVGNVGG